MSNFYETCDPEVKRNAENLVNKIKSHAKLKRTLPNTAAEFSEEKALKSLDALTKSKEYDDMVKQYYDC